MFHRIEMVKYIQDLMTLPHGEIAASSAMALANATGEGYAAGACRLAALGSAQFGVSKTSDWRPGPSLGA